MRGTPCGVVVARRSFIPHRLGSSVRLNLKLATFHFRTLLFQHGETQHEKETGRSTSPGGGDAKFSREQAALGPHRGGGVASCPVWRLSKPCTTVPPPSE